MNTTPDQAWLAAIFGVTADRCNWGSDWQQTPPHDALHNAVHVLPYRSLSYARLVDDLVTAVGPPALAEQILRDNPARLYGFAL